MALTKDQLLKMGFSALKKHCVSLGIKTPFGATKGAMIKLILKEDPPEENSEDSKLASLSADQFTFSGNAKDSRDLQDEKDLDEETSGPFGRNGSVTKTDNGADDGDGNAVSSWSSLPTLEKAATISKLLAEANKPKMKLSDTAPTYGSTNSVLTYSSDAVGTNGFLFCQPETSFQWNPYRLDNIAAAGGPGAGDDYAFSWNMGGPERKNTDSPPISHDTDEKTDCMVNRIAKQNKQTMHPNQPSLSTTFPPFKSEVNPVVPTFSAVAPSCFNNDFMIRIAIDFGTDGIGMFCPIFPNSFLYRVVAVIAV